MGEEVFARLLGMLVVEGKEGREAYQISEDLC